jgi:isopenicillin N synthase-like dioxygenase
MSVEKFGIPSVDLADFLSGDETKKQNFVDALGKAYREIGFVAVKNHGLSDETVHELYKQVKNFFNLPNETKDKYAKQEDGQRGYTAFGREHAKNSNKGDLKEFWQFGQVVDDENDPLFNTYPQNVFCEEIPEFNEVGLAVYYKLEDVGRSMLQAIALHLGLDEFYFEEHVDNGNSILRAIHYPPITEAPEGAVRAGEHEDINLITLLIGASADGLQVLNRQNQWVPITVLEDHIVVNVGDMLQRLTNNVLKSTTHRVVNPPKEKWGESRFSVPFFLHPRPEMSLACLPECIEMQNGVKHYEDITSDDYLNERLREIGLKK